jgi:hypothetical protein
VDEFLNNRHKEILHKLLANPADNGAAYSSNLQEMVKAYPQSGLLRALYGRALNERSPATAGAYFDSRALYKMLHHHDNLLEVAPVQIFMQADSQPTNGKATQHATPAATTTEAPAPKTDDSILTDQPPAFPDVLNVQWPEQDEVVKTEDKNLAAEPGFADQLDKPVEEFVPWQNTQETTNDEPLGRAPWETDEDIADEPAYVTPQPEQNTWQPEEEAAPAYTGPEQTQWEEPVQHEEEAPPVYETPAEPAQWETNTYEQAYQPEAQQYAEPDPYNEPYTEPVAETAPWGNVQEDYYAATTEEPVEASTWQPEYIEEETPIEEETYDEITGIDDINIAHNPADFYEEPGTPIIPVEHAYEEPFADTQDEEEQPAEQDEADRLIMDNIAATDFFVFDRAFGDKKAEEPAQPEFYATPQNAPAPPVRETAHLNYKEPAQNDLSRYHDEKMPYTFMWWLDKTRKEHGSLYQPYAKAPANAPAKPVAPTAEANAAPDELQQQYFENIFHLSSVDELTNEPGPTVEFDMQSKEDRIIQRFIAEDPHIHPPVGEKLDSENKAKKSSEDSNDLVTETLARIYADQMLFPKAIATYKKLMLKFPEKSRYFASRIENLEKKTN